MLSGAARGQGGDGESGGTARADAVLATLGYPRRHGASGPSLKSLVIYGGAAVAIGFVGLSLLIVFLSPSTLLPGPATGRAGDGGHGRRGRFPRPPSPDRTPIAPPLSSPAVLPPLDRTRAQAPSCHQPPGLRPGAAGAVVLPAPGCAHRTCTASGAVPPPSADLRDRGTGDACAGAAAPRTTVPAPRHPGQPRPRPRHPGYSAPAPAARLPARRAPVSPRPSGASIAAGPAGAGARGPRRRPRIISASRSTTSASATSTTPSRSTARCSTATRRAPRCTTTWDCSIRIGGQLDDAVKEFQKAIESIRKYVRAHNNLGVALLRGNQLDGAAAELRVALAADPRNVESLVNLALVQKAAGRAADARDLLRRAVSLDSHSSGAHYNLAVVADEAGDTPRRPSSTTARS